MGVTRRCQFSQGIAKKTRAPIIDIVLGVVRALVGGLVFSRFFDVAGMIGLNL